jgi:hypothetical protein
LQTAADSTQLAQRVPEDASTPFSAKLHEDLFRAYNADVPSLDVEVAEESLLKMYKEMVTMRRMEHLLMRCTRANSFVVSAILPLVRCASLFAACVPSY